MLSRFSHVRFSVAPWTSARQAPQSMGFSRQEYLEWVAMPSCKESSWPRDRTQVSCTAGRCFTPEPPMKLMESTEKGKLQKNAPLKMDSEGRTWTCSMKGGVYQADECCSPGMRQRRLSTEVMLWCCSLAKSCPSLWPMDCSTPDLPVLHYLQEFAQTYPLSQWCFLSILSSAALVSLWAGFILGALRVRKSYQCVFFPFLLSHSTVTGESTAISGHNQEQSLQVFLPPLRGWQATQVSPERLSWKDTGR